MHEARKEAEFRSERIAALNDRLRTTGQGGRTHITGGVEAQGATFIARAVEAVRAFDAFDGADNDPYGEHDFGAVKVDGRKLFWKVDYYDTALEYASPDPADPEITTRVLTIMLAEEY